MVKRIFELMGKEIRGLHEAAYLLAFFALLSQILGLVQTSYLFTHQLKYSFYHFTSISILFYGQGLSGFRLIVYRWSSVRKSAFARFQIGKNKSHFGIIWVG